MFKSVSLGGVLVTALPERGHQCPQLGWETLKVRNTDVGYVNPQRESSATLMGSFKVSIQYFKKYIEDFRSFMVIPNLRILQGQHP